MLSSIARERVTPPISPFDGEFLPWFEYGLIAGGIALAIIAVVMGIGPKLNKRLIVLGAVIVILVIYKFSVFIDLKSVEIARPWNGLAGKHR